MPPETLPADTDDRSRFLRIEGLKVHYKDEGVGGQEPPVVLLHGTAASLDTWDGWVGALAPNHRVVRMDLPGFGLTGPNTGHRYAAEDDVAFLDAFFDTLRLEQVALAGNSLGGGIALRYALAHPKRVSRLILIDSAGLPHPKLWFLELLALPGIGHALRWMTPRFGTRRMLKQVYADDSKVTEELVNRYHSLLLRQGNREALRARWRFPRPSLANRLREIEVPTLILWGKLDAWMPVANAYRFRDAIPASKLVVYSDLGHVPMEEAPERTAKDVRAFLEDPSSTPERAESPRRILILVHGIRTYGGWQEKFEELFADADGGHGDQGGGGVRPRIHIEKYKYGFLPVVDFLVPFYRSLAARRFGKELEELRRQHPDARVDIVAHSFGTHLVGRALLRLHGRRERRWGRGSPGVGTVLLAGSILKRGFPWRELIGGGAVGRVVNECGLFDWVVVLARLAFLGHSGLEGFHALTGSLTRVFNRYYRTGHSGFFQGSFMEERWVELFATSDDPAPVNQAKGGFKEWLPVFIVKSTHPIRALLVLLPLVLLLGFYFRHSVRAEARLAENLFAASVVAEREHHDVRKALLLASEAVRVSPGRLERALAAYSQPGVLFGPPSETFDLGRTHTFARRVSYLAARAPRSVHVLPGPIEKAAASADLDRLAFSTPEILAVYEVGTRKTVTLEPAPPPPFEIDSLALSADGRWAAVKASSSREDGDASVFLWDLWAPGETAQSKKLPKGPFKLVFTADSRLLLVIGAERGWIRDLTAAGTPFTDMENRLATRWQMGSSFPPDPVSSRAAVWVDSRTVRVAQLTGGPAVEASAPAVRHEHPVRDAIATTDGLRLITVSGGTAEEASVLSVWDARAGTLVVSVEVKGPIRLRDATDDGALVLVSVGNGLMVFDPCLERLEPVRKGEPMREGEVPWAMFGDRGSLVIIEEPAIFGQGSGIRVQDRATGRLLFRLPPKLSDGHAFASPDGRRLATLSPSGLLAVWDVTVPPQPPSIVLKETGGLVGGAFDPRGERALTAAGRGADLALALWGARDGRRVWRTGVSDPAMAFGHPFIRLAFSLDGQRYLTAWNDSGRRGRVQVYSATKGKAQSRAPIVFDGPLMSAALSRDGTRVVTAQRSGPGPQWIVQQRDVSTGRVLFERGPYEARSHRLPENCDKPEVFCGFTRDGSHYVLAGPSGVSFSIRAVDDGQAIGPEFRFLDNTGWPRQIALSLLWQASDLRTAGASRIRAALSPGLSLWLTGSGNVTLVGLSGRGLRIAGVTLRSPTVRWTPTLVPLSPDGRLLFSVSVGQSTKLVDVLTGEEITVDGYTFHETTVLASAVTDEGSLIALTGSGEVASRALDERGRTDAWLALAGEALTGQRLVGHLDVAPIPADDYEKARISFIAAAERASKAGDRRAQSILSFINRSSSSPPPEPNEMGSG